MDPITITSLAAAAVAFVDFGSQFFRHGLHVVRASLVEESRNAALLDTSKSLSAVSETMTARLEGVEVNGESEERLLKVCHECQELAADIRERLESVKTMTKAKVVKHKLIGAFNALFGDDEVENYLKQLAKMKEDISFLALLGIWESTMKQGEGGLTVGDQLRDIRRDMVGAVDENTRAFARQLTMVAEGQTYGARSLREHFIHAVNRSNWQPKLESVREILVTGCVDLICRADKLTLDSLIFPGSVLREEMIPSAHSSTFRWVLDDGPDEWVSLPGWLEEDTTTPYWITGKPGSGKSTLMKYLLSQPALKQRLHTWAGDKPLLFGAFYLWNAHISYGNKLEGLLRILLSQILSLMPELIPLVVPRRWALLSLLESDPPSFNWDISDLMQAFHRLGKEGESRFKLVIFIDGLDELDGNHEALIQFINTMRAEYRIKFCVTSRPWPIFADAFNRSPSFRMQDLTNRDISNYVGDRLGASNAYTDLSRLFPVEMNNIRAEMVGKAQGVFLWVSMVMDLILKVMTDDPRLPVLQEIMASLPGNISELYDAIWERVDLPRKARGSKLIQLVNASSGSLACETLWLADEDNFTGAAHQAQYTSSAGTPGTIEVDAIIPIVKRTVASNTGGILEVSVSGNITFLHRTARDCIHQPETWKKVCELTPEAFNPFIALSQVLMARLLSGNPEELSKDDFRLFVFKILALASRVEPGHPCTPQLVTLLDELDGMGRDKMSPSSPDKLDMIFSTDHWTRELYNIQSCEYTFMGLASAFAVTAYIEAKLFERPSGKLAHRHHPTLKDSSRTTKKRIGELWNWDSPAFFKKWREMPDIHRLSLLENAIFGWGLAPPQTETPPRYLLTLPEEVSTIVSFEVPQRFQTIQCLLRAGASPRQPGLGGTSIQEGLKRTTRGPVKHSKVYMSGSFLRATGIGSLMEALFRLLSQSLPHQAVMRFGWKRP